MRFTDEAKMILGVILASLLLLILGALAATRSAQSVDRSRLIPDDAVVVGLKDAPVYLVEFSDFQCPACKAFAPVVEQILKKHGDKMLFVYRHFPLPQHQYAEYAAFAFEAANEQGKGWEMYDYMFANQLSLSEEVISKGAKELGLNMEQFEQAVGSKKIKEKIDQDVADGRLIGINSTPTFFLNGQKLNLSSVDDLQKAVDEAIAKN